MSNPQEGAMMSMAEYKIGVGAVAIAIAAFVAQPASAILIHDVIEDANSTAVFSSDGLDGGGGHIDWLVDGVDVMGQQWFYYRIGDAGPEAAIHTISAPVVTLQNTNVLDARPDMLTVGYANASVEVVIDYLLRGGQAGSGMAVLGELIRVTNITNAPMELSFFQYVDFELGAPESLALVGGPVNTAQQSGVFGNVGETVVTPAPSLYQAGSGSTLIDSLTDGATTTLNNNAVSAGDANWAFQWDVTLAPGETLKVSKVKTVTLIPEPASVALMGLGGLMLATGRRRNARHG